MALNMIKKDDTYKQGIKAKRKRAGWDKEFLLSLLALGDS